MQIPFAPSTHSSLGVEWELQLVDPETRELTSGAIEILDELRPAGAEEHPKAKHELLQSTIEVVTGVCQTVGEAKADLAETVRTVAKAADRRGLALMCAGTHPITNWNSQKISPKPRYEQLVENLQWLARRLQIFGVHVHVGVRSPEKVIPIVNALTSYVPHFLALSASSPYWVGHDTGLASSRSKVFEALPTAGLPYQLSGWDQFESYMGTLISTRTIDSVREVWWDIRPHPDFAPSSCASATGCPRWTRWAPSPRWPSAWSNGWTARSTAATGCRRRRTGWSARTSGAPPGSASRPRSSSTTRTPSCPCAGHCSI